MISSVMRTKRKGKMLDYLEIFDRLNREKIKYIVVGGMAVNFYGIPRMTYDVDLLLYLEDDNLKKFLKLMKRWSFKPKVPVDIMDLADSDKRKSWIKDKHMKAFNLVNPKWGISEIDIIIDTPVDYQKALKGVNKIRVHNVLIPVISRKDLIKMKKVSDRQQDKSDIRHLKRLNNE